LVFEVEALLLGVEREEPFGLAGLVICPGGFSSRLPVGGVLGDPLGLSARDTR
jgi:hypothetical protein